MIVCRLQLRIFVKQVTYLLVFVIDGLVSLLELFFGLDTELTGFLFEMVKARAQQLTLYVLVLCELVLECGVGLLQALEVVRYVRDLRVQLRYLSLIGGF